MAISWKTFKETTITVLLALCFILSWKRLYHIKVNCFNWSKSLKTFDYSIIRLKTFLFLNLRIGHINIEHSNIFPRFLLSILHILYQGLLTSMFPFCCKHNPFVCERMHSLLLMSFKSHTYVFHRHILLKN